MRVRSLPRFCGGWKAILGVVGKVVAVKGFEVRMDANSFAFALKGAVYFVRGRVMVGETSGRVFLGCFLSREALGTRRSLLKVLVVDSTL